MGKVKYTGNCEYCGSKVDKNQKICPDCRIKLRLVRQIQQMIKDTFERVKKDVNG